MVMTKRPNRYALVQVTFGDGMYTAECEELHLVTEAPSLDALAARVWELVPDMIEANGLTCDPDHMRLHFEFEQDRRIAL